MSRLPPERAMTEPGAAALAVAERVTAAWAMSRHGGSLSAVPLSVCRELERLIGGALEAFAAARVAEERERLLDDLREALEFLDHSGNQRAVLSGKFSTPSARHDWFNRVRARLRAALRAPTDGA